MGPRVTCRSARAACWRMHLQSGLLVRVPFFGLSKGHRCFTALRRNRGTEVNRLRATGLHWRSWLPKRFPTPRPVPWSLRLSGFAWFAVFVVWLLVGLSICRPFRARSSEATEYSVHRTGVGLSPEGPASVSALFTETGPCRERTDPRAMYAVRELIQVPLRSRQGP